MSIVCGELGPLGYSGAIGIPAEFRDACVLIDDDDDDALGFPKTGVLGLAVGCAVASDGINVWITTDNTAATSIILGIVSTA